MVILVKQLGLLRKSWDYNQSICIIDNICGLCFWQEIVIIDKIWWLLTKYGDYSENIGIVDKVWDYD